MTRRGLALDVHGGEGVETLQLGRAETPAGRGEGRERHHLALLVADIETLQVLRQAAVGRVGLDIDLLYTACLDEVVDIGATKGRCQRAMNGAERHTERTCPIPVHIHPVLGRVVHAVRPHRHQAGFLHGHAEKLVACGGQCLMAEAAPVLQLKVKACCHAQLHHRRRWEGHDLSLFDLRESLHGPACHSLDLQIRTLALLPVLELDKAHGQVLPLAAKVAAHCSHHIRHSLFLVFKEMTAHFADHSLTLLQGRA